MGAGSARIDLAAQTVSFGGSVVGFDIDEGIKHRLLGGLVLNATIGWWWADPIAGLAMVPIIAREGIDGFRGQSACADCC